MNRPLKFVLMGIALVLFIGSFFLKQFIPANPDTAEYVLKGIAIALLAFIVLKTRLKKRPFDPY